MTNKRIIERIHSDELVVYEVQSKVLFHWVTRCIFHDKKEAEFYMKHGHYRTKVVATSNG